jgi:hypothetical protein
LDLTDPLPLSSGEDQRQAYEILAQSPSRLRKLVPLSKAVEMAERQFYPSKWPSFCPLVTTMLHPTEHPAKPI